MYSKNSKEYYTKKGKSDIKKILGNQVLKSIKSIKNDEYLKQALLRSSLQNLFRFLSTINESINAKIELNIFKGELSKQAKLDCARTFIEALFYDC